MSRTDTSPRPTDDLLTHPRTAEGETPPAGGPPGSTRMQPPDRRRIILVAAAVVLAIVVAVLATVGGRPSHMPLRQGLTPGLADGWFQPDAGAHAVAAAPRSDDVRLRQGMTPGRADGWFEPPSGDLANPRYPVGRVR